MARPALQVIAAFFLAPLAGAIAVFFTSVHWSFAFMGHGTAPQPLEVLAVSAIIASVSIFFCMFYTLIVGGLITAYMAATKKTPHAAIVIIGGAMAGLVPLIIETWGLFHVKTAAGLMEQLYVPALALAGGLATSGTFWLIGVRSN